MAEKMITLKKKIGAEVFDLMVKTVGAQVTATYNGTTTDLNTILGTILTDRASAAEFKALKASYDTLTGGASEAYDTLKEIGEWINSHQDLYTKLVAITDKKVDKVDGKQLSTEDFTTELKTKLTDLYTKEQLDTKFSDAATATEAAKTAADNAQAAAEAAQGTANAAKAQADTNKNDIAELQTKCVANARVIVSATQPEDLTEADLWLCDTTPQV
nr:MAG TPA: hypothetical protein [Caudoviricetes sp.]